MMLINKTNASDLKDEEYIKQCIRLARRGEKSVSPNPMVGCVIVKNNKIIGRGYHKIFGGPHAEVNAINNVSENGYDISGSSLYINLEPCSFHGKTPPCTELIISRKIKNVYIGIKDPNPLVNGKGIKQLLNAGIKVKFNILKNECEELNKAFIKFVKYKIPYISLKVAQSLDGKIALKNFSSKWISNNESRKYVKSLRNKYDAILIGHNTAIKDNPSLLPEKIQNKIPFRIILSDKPEKIPANLKILTDKFRENTILVSSDFNRKSFINILKYLFTMNISKILVEGGAFVFSRFVEYNLFDDMYIFTADKIIGKGISAFDYFEIENLDKSVHLNLNYSKRIGNNTLQYFTKT
ncbi:MAG: bifunctional diaminohydroxyphosphoribosylaminopyrimidine deaminase/5-amino-6-(5-phosphoribosylamino)uracil reductase RibD [Ignavibacteria bacterium]|nr:bifunctional diaminohydroxyphosphoribosylaminopyrimidine deaminase/5-amino-6-(5-phosphoribosylamino)uracil reductase RibD [Ignavibacteria bacterium]